MVSGHADCRSGQILSKLIIEHRFKFAVYKPSSNTIGVISFLQVMAMERTSQRTVIFNLSTPGGNVKEFFVTILV